MSGSPSFRLSPRLGLIGPFCESLDRGRLKEAVPQRPKRRCNEARFPCVGSRATGSNVKLKKERGHQETSKTGWRRKRKVIKQTIRFQSSASLRLATQGGLRPGGKFGTSFERLLTIDCGRLPVLFGGGALLEVRATRSSPMKGDCGGELASAMRVRTRTLSSGNALASFLVESQTMPDAHCD
jgi:hypothetical protein